MTDRNGAAPMRPRGHGGGRFPGGPTPSGRAALGSRPGTTVGAEALAGASASQAGLSRPPAAPRPQAGPARPSTPAPAASRATFASGGSDAPPRKLETEIGWRMADAYLALAALAAAELLVVGALRWRELVGPYELARALRDLLPLALAAAAPCAALLGAVLEVTMRAERAAFRAVATLLAGAFGGAVAFGVSTGRMLEGGRRAPFIAAVALVGAGAAFALAPRVARALRRARAADLGRWLVLAVACAVVLLEIANARVLPRLYPAFHLGLAALTLVVATFATPALPARAARDGDRDVRRSPRLARAALALVLFAFGAALAPGAAERLSFADNIRLIYATHGPLLGHVVELAAVLSPPEPLDAAPLDERASGHAIDLRGRDIVLISVDALRADHVGAYGYERKITPNIDRLAAEGVRFEAAYTPTPHTSYAVSSLMTGKYIRPLVLQGLGEDSETFAQHLRRYGYKTAGFYPPAVFFIDGERFGALRDRALDFEYQKIEFASASLRVEQVRTYLAGLAPEQRAFLWVHLFEPHEPYEAHPEHPLGDRDIDRYDAEIAVADAGVGAIVAEIRKGRPNAVVVVTADHGEEFGEHGGRYHGTTVYEEQARVPLIVSAPGLLSPRAVRAPVQLVDLLPTVLAGLGIPRPARVRGTDLGPLLAGGDEAAEQGRAAPPGGPPPLPGFAFSETETQTLLAKGTLRLVCARKIGACALYDVATDPRQQEDISALRPAELAAMRAELRSVEASHGRYEVRGLRREGKGWPDALRRGIAGDADAVVEVAALLDDADVAIRRKAGEVLFDLRRAEAAPSLRLALVRDEDDEVRRWAALALTRLGEGAPLTRDLVVDRDRTWRRLAALALAESGDRRGDDVLVAWLREAVRGAERGDGAADGEPTPFERTREIIDALAKIRVKAALPPLIAALGDVRLRPYAAAALAAIGEDAARPALAERLGQEPYQTARVAIAEALVKLGAGPELRAPLLRMLGTPDPLPGGLGFALRADILDLLGGPRERDLGRLRRFAKSGVGLAVVIPKAGNGKGVRVLCRARTDDGRPGEVRFGAPKRGVLPPKRDGNSLVPARAPELDPERAVTLAIPPGSEPTEAFATLPPAAGAKPGHFGNFVVYATQNVEVSACAVVPLSDEIPPPPPAPWSPEEPGARPRSGDGAPDAHRPD
ncbi:sulfatase-like hydrolase/transferase [Sorangium sp. So ce1036]|uniref:sulfatase-like hydrolase/transferase n=1 Tax=Sorangium sp. So ce1036 TaxID=3133328 RepID=UPI003EFEC1F3